MQTLSTHAIEDHLPLIRSIARQVSRGLPRHISIDELIGAGTIGLCEAAARFDAREQGGFQRFAAFRIRGAMLDVLRGMDWLSRRDRARVQDGLLSDVGARALDQERRPDPLSPAPDSALHARERSAALRVALMALAPRKRSVLEMYYVEELTLREIAEVLGVSESRVCQIHRAALDDLRAALDPTPALC